MFQLANDDRLPKKKEDTQLYFWCKNQRQAYRGNNHTTRLTDTQIEVCTSEAVRDSTDGFSWQQLKATGFDFTTCVGHGN